MTRWECFKCLAVYNSNPGVVCPFCSVRGMIRNIIMLESFESCDRCGQPKINLSGLEEKEIKRQERQIQIYQRTRKQQEEITKKIGCLLFENGESVNNLSDLEKEVRRGTELGFLQKVPKEPEGRFIPANYFGNYIEFYTNYLS